MSGECEYCGAARFGVLGLVSCEICWKCGMLNLTEGGED